MSSQFIALSVAKLVATELRGATIQDIANYFETEVSGSATLDDIKKLEIISKEKRIQIEAVASSMLFVPSLDGFSECNENPIPLSLKKQMTLSNFTLGKHENDYYLVFQSVDHSKQCLDTDIIDLLLNEYKSKTGVETFITIISSEKKIRAFNQQLHSVVSSREYVSNLSPTFFELINNTIENECLCFSVDINNGRAVPTINIEDKRETIMLDDSESSDLFQDFSRIATLVDFESDVTQQSVSGSVYLDLNNTDVKLKIQTIPVFGSVIFKCIVELALPVPSKLNLSILDQKAVETGGDCLITINTQEDEQKKNIALLSELTVLSNELNHFFIVDVDAQELIHPSNSNCKVMELNLNNASNLAGINPLAVYLGNIYNIEKRNLYIALVNKGLTVVAFCTDSLKKTLSLQHEQ